MYLSYGTTGADASGTARACVHPRFVTSDTNGGRTFGRYYVHNNMWNVGGYNVRETLRACSAGNWYATATADNYCICHSIGRCSHICFSAAAASILKWRTSLASTSSATIPSPGYS